MRHTAAWAELNRGKEKKTENGTDWVDIRLGSMELEAQPHVPSLPPLSSHNGQHCCSFFPLQTSRLDIIPVPSLCSLNLNLITFYRQVSVSKYPIYNSSHCTEQAFGSDPNCLGIIIVRDLPPAYPRLRERLLNLGHAFAQLDEPVRENYADAKSRYRFEPTPIPITD